MRRLLGRLTSINVRKAVFVLEELGLSFTREDWGQPLRDPKVPEFLALNPNGQVPVLVEDDFVLWESQPIMRYLAAQAGSDLWPADLRERALVDQWLTWQATELNPTWGYAVYALLRKAPGYDDQSLIADSLGRWGGKMEMLERQLKQGGGFAANGRLSLADIVLALSTHRWLAIGQARPALPHVQAHHAMMQARPAGARCLGPDTF